MKIRNVVTTLLVVLCLALFTAPAQAQRVIVTPSTYATAGYTVATFVTTSTAGNATPMDIATTTEMIYGLDANAGINTAGTQVFINFFNVAAASVTPGTTAPIFSYPIQAGGTSNGTKTADIIKFGGGLALSVPLLSANCTTTKATTGGGGATGTGSPCNINIIMKH